MHIKITPAVRNHPNIPFDRYPNKNNIWGLKRLKWNEIDLVEIIKTNPSKFNKSWLRNCRRLRKQIIKNYSRSTWKLIR